MRTAVVLPLALLCGCSTAPVAGLLDCVAPSRYESGKRPPKPRDADGPPPPGVFPEPRRGRAGERLELGEPVPVPEPPPPSVRN